MYDDMAICKSASAAQASAGESQAAGDSQRDERDGPSAIHSLGGAAALLELSGNSQATAATQEPVIRTEACAAAGLDRARRRSQIKSLSEVSDHDAGVAGVRVDPYFGHKPAWPVVRKASPPVPAKHASPKLTMPKPGSRGEREQLNALVDLVGARGGCVRQYQDRLAELGGVNV